MSSTGSKNDVRSRARAYKTPNCQVWTEAHFIRVSSTFGSAKCGQKCPFSHTWHQVCAKCGRSARKMGVLPHLAIWV
jgi:hypothetical protein